MAERGIGRAVFRTGAFIVLVAAPVGVFASLPPTVADVRGGTPAAQATAECDAAAAPFARLFPPVDRARRARAERACAALAHSIDPVVVHEADVDARALLREETDLAWHMVGVLVICGLGALLAMLGLGVVGALYGVAAGVAACWGGVHVWPLLVAGGTALLALPCSQGPGTPADERVPAPGPAALLTALVGVAWALPVLAFLAGRLRLAAPHSAREALFTLVAEIVAGTAFVVVVVPALAHFLRSRTREGRGRAAKLGLTMAVVVFLVAAAVVGYAVWRGTA
jgi:hypothetical protein